MSKKTDLNDFIEASIPIIVENKRSTKRMPDPKVPVSLAQDLSFDDLLTHMGKLNTQDKNVGIRAEAFGLIIVEKMKNLKADEKSISWTQQKITNFALDAGNTKARERSLEEVAMNVREFEPNAGKPKSIWQKLTGG